MQSDMHKNITCKPAVIRMSVLFILLITTLFQKGFAQEPNKTSPPQLLNAYYNIKNALVASNPVTTAKYATAFILMVNNDTSIADLKSRNILLKDAGIIAQSKDLKVQRDAFSYLSVSLFSLIKSATLYTRPVYYAFCPMKKAHWLSNEPEIKNPYFGNAMLTCGKVEETIK